LAHRRRSTARPGSAARSQGLDRARAQFEADFDAFAVVALDDATCRAAASVSEITGVRTLDALHLGAAQRIGGSALPFVTFDLRRARAARELGFTVLGV
jgi:predicted nucleic acid-binding protein